MLCEYFSGLIGIAIGNEMKWKCGENEDRIEREQIWRKEWLVEIQV